MGLNLDDATKCWDNLTRHLDSFIEAWEASEQPPSIGNHLPDDQDLRALVLVELVKLDLEFRIQGNASAKRIEQYVEEHPDLAINGHVPSDLIYEEYHVRRAAGDTVAADEYIQRFPDNADELRRLMNIQSATVSTAIFEPGHHSLDLQAGERINDFDLLIQLGKGAFGSVFLARQLSMQRLVALKVSADKGSEPQTLGQLDHPNIVRVYDQRQLPDRKARLMYMQYVAGGTLQAVVDRVKGLPPEKRSGKLLLDAVNAEAERGGQVTLDTSSNQLANESWPDVICRIGAQLASALDYAHDRGVLHRDIKPANVLLAADGSPKLADFNISFSSKLDGAAPAAYFGGSLAYMSPEQLEACNPSHDRKPDELDGRSDIYSLGLMLWELLVGERPFPDEEMASDWKETLEQMVVRRRKGIGLAGSESDEDVREVQEVLLKCLAPQCDDRFSSGRELAQQLLICLQPHTKRLLRVPDVGWRGLVRRFPAHVVLLAVLVPNALAGVFNFLYNWTNIIPQLDDLERAKRVFWNIQLVINSIAFPIGLLIIFYLMLPVRTGLRGLAGDTDGSVWTRSRALALGSWAALIGVVEWIIGGVAYPISLHLLIGGLNGEHYLHFVMSLAICGLVAAVYPFFLIMFLTLRVMYPALLNGAPPSSEEEVSLDSVAQRAGWFAYAAAAVPGLGMALLVVTSIYTESQNPIALLVLSLVGILGFGLAFILYRAIQRDIGALKDSINFRSSTDR